MIYSYVKISIKFDGICLREDSISFIHRTIVDLYIFYKVDTWSRDLNTDFTLISCLLGTVNLTMNIDPDKYGYSGYGIGFDARSQCSLSNGKW